MLHDIPTGSNPPESINVVIEVESKSRDKYEYDDEYETFVLDRILLSSVMFPFDYGFIPRTWCKDDDALDVMVLSPEPLSVGCMVRARPIGVLRMEDEKGDDPKILAVLEGNPKGVKDIKEVPEHRLMEIQEFFVTYKRLEPGKWVKFNGWGDSSEAKKLISEAVETYRKAKEAKEVKEAKADK